MSVPVIIGAGWLAFWLYWIAASSRAKAGRSSWRPLALLRGAVAVVVLVMARFRVLDVRAFTHDPWLQGVGLALFVVGLALAVWARLVLGTNWGMPMSQKDQPELVTAGPYRAIRHPIYSGIITAMFGTALAVSPYWLIAFALIGGYFVYSAFVEERTMSERFPDTYQPYKRSTKMLLPFLL